MKTIQTHRLNDIPSTIVEIAREAYDAGVRHQDDPAHLPRVWKDRIGWWAGVVDFNWALAILHEPDNRPVRAYTFGGREYRTLAGALSAQRAWLRRTRDATYRGEVGGAWAPRIVAVPVEDA